MNYYNDNDPKSAERLRQLVSVGLVPAGYVDQRSIADVRPDDLTGYTQCHFFAGIGGWSLALKLAGIDPSTRLWTGSCPCQPFSAAGKRKGTADDRHLWPVFRDLIAQCNPPVVFGEQVASADGRAWLATVRADLEALGYAVGAADLCAAGVGAPHIRQRLYFVGLADPDDSGSQGRIGMPECAGQCVAGEGSMGGGLADSIGSQFRGEFGCGTGTTKAAQGAAREWERGRPDNSGGSSDDSMANPKRPSPPDSFWGTANWLFCRDGKWRPVEPGTSPLANGVPCRVALLRGYGNAIVPQVAATFIRAALAERKTD